MNYADFVRNGDFNGSCYELGSEGERYVRNPRYVVHGLNGIANPGNEWEEKMDNANMVVNLSADERGAIMMNSYIQLRSVCPNDQVAGRAAFYRMLAVRMRLISHSYTADVYHLDYVETALGAYTIDQGDPTADECKQAFNGLNREYLGIQSVFTNYVCLLAFFFKVRGHHYLQSAENDLNRIWNACQCGAVPIPFEIGFTYVLHAIPPIVLEHYWRVMAAKGRLAGALAIRRDSSPAGAAIISTIRQGLDDIRVIFQYFPDFIGEAVNDFFAQEEKYLTDPMAYSVNARLYGKVRQRLDEKTFSIVATFIVGIYTYAANDAPLMQSKALSRVAQKNPVTIAILAKATAGVVDKYGVSLAYGPTLKKIAMP